jgi:predicted nucleic acid-binding protein
MDEHSIIYDINQDLIRKSYEIVTMDGFSMLRGADLLFACIAYLEKAYLVTLDNDFRQVSHYISVINLNESREAPKYRDLFEMRQVP